MHKHNVKEDAEYEESAPEMTGELPKTIAKIVSVAAILFLIFMMGY